MEERSSTVIVILVVVIISLWIDAIHWKQDAQQLYNYSVSMQDSLETANQHIRNSNDFINSAKDNEDGDYESMNQAIYDLETADEVSYDSIPTLHNKLDVKY